MRRNARHVPRRCDPWLGPWWVLIVARSFCQALTGSTNATRVVRLYTELTQRYFARLFEKGVIAAADQRKRRFRGFLRISSIPICT